MEAFEVFNIVFCSTETKTTLKDAIARSGGENPPFFYRLLKKEKVSAQKQIVLRKGERSFLLPNASILTNLYGVAVPGDLIPRNFPDVEVFVQSTSPNRGLEAGGEACFLGRPTKRHHFEHSPIRFGIDSLTFREQQAVIIGSDDFGEVEEEIVWDGTSENPRLSEICPSLLREARHGDIFIGQSSLNGVLEQVGFDVRDFYVRQLTEVESVAYTVPVVMSEAPFGYWPECGEEGIAFRSPLLVKQSHQLWRKYVRETETEFRRNGFFDTLNTYFAPAERVTSLSEFPQAFVHLESSAHGTGWLRYEGETRFFAGEIEPSLRRFKLRRDRLFASTCLALSILLREFNLPKDIVRLIANLVIDF